MILVKIANKVLNHDRLLQELRPLGVGGISFIGFLGDAGGIQTPIATRSEWGHTTRGGVRTPKFADPGELHLEAPSDPGVALDNALAAHDFRIRSTGQVTAAARETDKVLVQADLDSGNPISADGVKALVRLVLFKNPLKGS